MSDHADDRNEAASHRYGIGLFADRAARVIEAVDHSVKDVSDRRRAWRIADGNEWSCRERGRDAMQRRFFILAAGAFPGPQTTLKGIRHVFLDRERTD